MDIWNNIRRKTAAIAMNIRVRKIWQTLLLLLLATGLARADEQLAADLNEWVFKLPVMVTDSFGREIAMPITVTGFKPAGDGPFPVVILNHGRSATNRARPARYRFTTVARYFVRRGFAVFVPTRIGYGENGTDPDPEDTGNCNGKVYAPGYEAGAVETVALLEYARSQPFAERDRALIVGQSFGGMLSVALAAKNLPGVVAAINFAGGGGGNPIERPGNPCRSDLLKDLYAEYGKTARTPTLWIYTENDRYFSPRLTRAWFEAFSRSGAVGEFRLLPAFKDNDGHSLFVRGFPIWRPIVD